MGIEEVVLANDPVEACANVWEIHDCVTAGTNWRVSELGFNWHTEDVLVDDLLINRYLIKKYRSEE
tara:strand:- start:115 stop:312 length:198 start_codon:yes stop_codon:yes gene_type:complete